MLLSVPASLTNVSRDQTVREDSNMQLLCEATGKPTPNVTWDRVLEDGSNGEVLHQGATWDFPNISRSASGRYRCTAYNGFGNPVGYQVKVNVTCKYLRVRNIIYEHKTLTINQSQFMIIYLM